MKNFLILLLMSIFVMGQANGQMTATDAQSVRTNELLTNGGFENGYTGWDFSGTTCTRSIEPSIIKKGKAALKFVCSAQSFYAIQDSTKYAAQFNLGANGMTSLQLYSATVGAVSVCSRNAGVNKDCITNQLSGGYEPVKIPSILNTTSNGIYIGATSVTGTFYLDDVSIDANETVTNAPGLGPEVVYTPTFTSFGTVSNVNFTYQQIGSNLLIKGTFTSGTVSSSEARISLPTGFTVLSSKPSLFMVGGVASSVASAFYPTALAEANASYLVFGSNSTARASLIKYGADTLVVSGGSLSIEAIVPVNQLQSSVPTYSDRCRDPRNCETVFSAKVSATGVVTDENLDWINGNCTNATTPVCTFVTNIFNGTIPNCWHVATNGASSFNLGSEVTTTYTAGFIGSSGSVIPGPRSIYCQRQGQDYINAKVNQIVGSFKGYSRQQATGWSSPSRAFGTSYQNTDPNTERRVKVSGQSGSGEYVQAEVSSDNSTWTAIGTYGNAVGAAEVLWTADLTVPPLQYYRVREIVGGTNFVRWIESQ